MKIQTFVILFFLKKIYFSEIWSVMSFMGQIFMSVNISLIALKKKMYDILMILVDLCEHFPWFSYPDPDPTDQNETDPNGTGSETLL